MIEGATANQPCLIIQLDDYTSDRGQQIGQVLSVASGLGFILPASRVFRHPARMKSLTEICAKCGQRLRTWALARLSADHITRRVSYIECRCLLLAVQPDQHDPKKIVAGWSNLRRFEDRVLNEFKRTKPGEN